MHASGRMIRKALAAGLGAAGALPMAAHASSMPSFACAFTEPFISILTYPGGARHDTPEGVTPVTEAALVADGAMMAIRLVLADGRALRLSVEEKPGSDGMSDRITPWSGTLEGTGGPAGLQGACIRFPDGTTPRPVVDVRDGDRLNVRSGPGVRHAVIAKLRPGELAWAHPVDLEGGWAAVAVARYPEGESGTVTVAEGWVNARYLGSPGGP